MNTGLDDISTQNYRAAPDDIARLGFAIAHASRQGPRQWPDCQTMSARGLKKSRGR